jgi:hypothetical protein
LIRYNNRTVFGGMVNLLKLIRYKREKKTTMNGEFREDIEVILYKMWTAVLCYKSVGRWFDPSWCQWILH